MQRIRPIAIDDAQHMAQSRGRTTPRSAHAPVERQGRRPPAHSVRLRRRIRPRGDHPRQRAAGRRSVSRHRRLPTLPAAPRPGPRDRPLRRRRQAVLLAGRGARRPSARALRSPCRRKRTCSRPAITAGICRSPTNSSQRRRVHSIEPQSRSTSPIPTAKLLPSPGGSSSSPDALHPTSRPDSLTLVTDGAVSSAFGRDGLTERTAHRSPTAPQTPNPSVSGRVVHVGRREPGRRHGVRVADVPARRPVR